MTQPMSRRSVEIVEVGPRDGLQNDSVMFSVKQKIEFVRRVAAAGIKRAEVASFVNPVRVPQMAGSEDVMTALGDVDITAIGLVLNVKGWERALAAGAREINLVVVSTDSFAERNSGTTTEGTIKTVEEVVPLALAAGVRPTVVITTSWGCPFEGDVPLDRIVSLAVRSAELGVSEVALADTIGVAVPAEVSHRIAEVRSAVGPNTRLRAHFHNTRNTGYANAWAAVEAGVDALDASLGGIGGCPFAPNATGNIATEDLAYLLSRSGVDTGIDLPLLLEASAWLESQLDRKVPSLVSKAGLFPAA